MKTDAKLHPSAVSIQIFEQKTAIFARNLTLFYVCKQILGKLQGLHLTLSSIEKKWGKHNAAVNHFTAAPMQSYKFLLSESTKDCRKVSRMRLYRR